MKKTCLIIFLIFTIVFSFSCKKKKDVSNIIVDTYPLKVMLNLYPEDAGNPIPPVNPDDGTGTDTTTENMVEIKILGTDNLYTETNISPDKAIMVDEGLTVSVKIKARTPADVIYVGGFPIEDVKDYSPISNEKYEFTTVMTGSKALIINISTDGTHELMEYKAFELRNEGRGYSRMYVHTNLDNALAGITENALASYKVGAKSFSIITLPKAQKYTLGLKAVPDGTYNLENWFPMLGISTGPDGTPDENGVIIPLTAGKKDDINAYVDASSIIDIVPHSIEDPIKLKAMFTAFPAWDGVSRVEPVRYGRSGYLVSLASEVAWIAYQTSIKNNFAGYIFQLQNDIDFNGHDFKGIAVGSQLFQGIIDGNGKSITNVRFLFDNSRAIDNNGFVGNLGISGVISNLTIASNVTIETIGGNNVGALVGRNFGKVFSSTNYADIDAGGTARAGNNIGGVVGYNDGVVSYAHNTGTISNAKSSVGGIIGYNTGKLYDSYNEGLIVGEYDVGGIVGLTENTITKVYNAGIVSNSNSTLLLPLGSNTGGLVGSIGIRGCQISHSYNVGEVTGGKYAGGVLGYSFGGAITIDRVYNIGIIQGNMAPVQVGGLIGGISATTTIGTSGTDGILNIYFLKNSTYNTGLSDNGIGIIEAGGTPPYSIDRYTDDFSSSVTGVGKHFKPITIWHVPGTPITEVINGISIRPILLGVGYQGD